MSVRVLPVLLLPFKVAASLLRLLAGPALVLGLSWWLLPTSVFVLLAVLVGLYTLVVLRAWRNAFRGMVRSVARGTVVIRSERNRSAGGDR